MRSPSTIRAHTRKRGPLDGLFNGSPKICRPTTARTIDRKGGLRMAARLLRLCCLLSGILVAAPALAQEGHPAKGTWVGYWGPTAAQNRVVIVLDYDGKNLTGAVNPGSNAVPIKLARLDITP